MATTTTQQETKDVIVPSGQYHVTYSWVLDSTSGVPVGMQIEETH